MQSLAQLAVASPHSAIRNLQFNCQTRQFRQDPRFRQSRLDFAYRRGR